jgi:cytochrome d ubiquinol oxidase subunit II
MSALDLPLIFAALLGVAIVIYVILDGFDLGVGVLAPFATPEERDRMLSSIGPFWDGNETWLVLATGILLVAFPVAHGAILGDLYIPVTVMLVALIARGVAFEFRLKVPQVRKPWWDAAFAVGSLVTALSQGFMLGLYILGLQVTTANLAFAALAAVGLAASYAFLGAAWLIGKTEGGLQRKAVRWARSTLWVLGLGMVAVSFATPFVSDRLFDKWLSWPNMAWLAPLPLAAALAWLATRWWLARLPLPEDRGRWWPFAGGVALFLLGFAGMAYSFFPYIVPESLTIADSAAAPESLIIILFGVVAVLPLILAYTVVSYWLFRGKARQASYAWPTQGVAPLPLVPPTKKEANEGV